MVPRSLGARAALVLAVTATVGLARPGLARADDAPTRPDWAFHEPGAEAALLAAGAAAHAVYFVPQQTSDWGPSHVQAFDRGLGSWSDLAGGLGGALVQLGAGYAFEAGYLAHAGAADPGLEAMHAVAVDGEALLFTSATTLLVKRLTGRCRPRAYHEGKCTAFDAFPSGHTSSVASFAGARLVRLVETPVDDGFALRAAPFALAEVATFTAGLLRVESGAHSWEDVLVGGLVGHAIGVAVALAHPAVEVRAAQVGAPPTTEAQGSAPVLFRYGGSF